MSNRNKQKGDRAERAVRDYLQTIWPNTRRTRAGWDEDLGDVIADTPRGLLCIQVKDVATPQWKTWFTQLEDQVSTLRANTTKPVIGGILIWKTRGNANPATWRTITTLNHLPQLIGEP